MHKIKVAHLQCLNNHYTKFEYKGMKILELQITQNRHHKSVVDRPSDEWTDLCFAKVRQIKIIWADEI